MTDPIPCTRSCKGGSCKPVMRQGATYRCPAALASALGISRNAVYQSLHRYGDAEHCGIRKGIKPGTRLGNHRRPIKVGPHQWPSISAMAIDLKVSRRQLGYQLKAAPQSVLALVMRTKG
jgi:hypothetical protein